MKAEDVVLKLASSLPKFSDCFTVNANIVSMVRSGTTVLAETDEDHQFSINDGVFINGTKAPLNIISFSRSGSLGTVEFEENHDWTKKTSRDAISGIGSVSVQVEGANEAEFNGQFTISQVVNRKTLEVIIEDSGPTSATGTMISNNSASQLQQYNGLSKITATPSASSFEFETDLTSLNPILDGANAKGRARISASISLERILDSYTRQSVSSCWLFAVIGDVTASKNRAILSDQTDNLQRGSYIRQQLNQSLTLYLVQPTSDQISAREARDLAEEQFRPICQSILNFRFDCLLYTGAYNPLQFVSHGFAAYNTAYYVHQYDFEQSADLQFEDSIGYDEDVAFRDISLSMGVDLGSAILDNDIDLDAEPIGD